MNTVKTVLLLILVSLVLPVTAFAALSVVPVEGMRDLGTTKEIRDGDRTVFKETSVAGSLEVVLATAEGPAERQIMYREAKPMEDDGLELSGAETAGLSFQESFRNLGPGLD